jgi:hypothetical protein
MTNEIQLNKEKELIAKEFIDKVTNLETFLLNSDLPGIEKFENGISESFPLTHSFSDGVYVREMFIPAGSFMIGKIHKFSHTVFLLKGKILVATENGVVCHTAPCYISSPAGVKRAVHTLEDTIWVNVHANPENTTDIKTLENNLVCSSYKAYDEYKLLNK